MSKFQESDHYYHYEQQPSQKGCLHINGVYYQHQACDNGIDSNVWRAFHQVEDIIKMPKGIYIKWKNSTTSPDEEKKPSPEIVNNTKQVNQFNQRQEKRDNEKYSSMGMFFNTDYKCKKESCQNARFKYTLKCKDHQNVLLTFKEVRQICELHVIDINKSKLTVFS